MKKITILLLSTLAVAAGCKRFTNINQNQNQPTTVTPNVILAAALNSSAAQVADRFQSVTRWMGYWSRSGNYIADVNTEQYELNTNYASGDWNSLFATMGQYANLEKITSAQGNTYAFYTGACKVMIAMHYETLVDAFGDVPYSQAFNVNKYPTPSYDGAQAVYDNIVTQLDSAVTLFTTAAAGYVSSPSATDVQYDIVFGRGTNSNSALRMQEWIQFANTVKLRILMTESQVKDAAYINGEIAKATASVGTGVSPFLPAGTSASVNPGYGVASNAQENPLYATFFSAAGSPQQNEAYYRANTYAVKFYQGSNDTYRPQLVYVPTSGTSIGSNYDGDPNSASNAATSAIGNPGVGGVINTAAQDQPLITDFESLFLQAEATARGFLPGGAAKAESLVQMGIEQNFIFLGETKADADAYFTANSSNPDVDVLAAVATPPPATNSISGNKVDQTAGLQAVMTDEWIALNGVDWFQAWTNYRRTQFPTTQWLGLSHASTHTKNAIPYRQLYPQSEYNTNGAHVPAGQTAYSPLFWDKSEH